MLMISFNKRIYFMNRMDARNFYMQNCFVYARRFGISIGEHIDGHFNRTMHRYIVSIRFNYVQVNSHSFVFLVCVCVCCVYTFTRVDFIEFHLYLFLFHYICHRQSSQSVSNCAHFLFKYFQ